MRRSESEQTAVHPGFGFLSENADFAKACKDAGLIFVGPKSATIRALGDKISAKKLIAKAKVPTVPGYMDDDQSIDTLVNEAGKDWFSGHRQGRSGVAAVAA